MVKNVLHMSRGKKAAMSFSDRDQTVPGLANTGKLITKFNNWEGSTEGVFCMISPLPYWPHHAPSQKNHLGNQGKKQQLSEGSESASLH